MKLISAAEDGCVRLWSLVERDVGKCLRTLHAHDSPITSLAVRSLLVATAASDGTVKVYDFSLKATERAAAEQVAQQVAAVGTPSPVKKGLQSKKGGRELVATLKGRNTRRGGGARRQLRDLTSHIQDPDDFLHDLASEFD